MSTNAISGVGTKFKRGNGAQTEVFTDMPEVLSIGGPSPKADDIDVTSLDTVGGYREKITGFIDSGELQVSFNWTLSIYGELLADLQNRTARNYQILYPNTEATIEQIRARVSGLTKSITPEKQITCDVTFLIDGVIDLQS
jgi:predicted secreted protein